jgi:NAD(P)-dependent dehydrogenase (short-subunit alcohol dehydrogenase family)
MLASGRFTTPAEIEANCSRVLAEREIRATLAALEAAGATVRYHSLDARDTAALGALVDELYATHGRIDGVVHGAGVLDDRFLRDKTADGFDRVYATKVDVARVLVDRLRPDTRFVVFFGSISGVTGNRGQVDYSAANDALDELAWRGRATSTGTRWVSLDWGPWAGGGMVSPELEREYQKRGVGLVHPTEGIAAFLAEIARPAGEPAQVVVLRADPAAFAPPRRPVAEVVPALERVDEPTPTDEPVSTGEPVSTDELGRADEIIVGTVDG